MQSFGIADLKTVLCLGAHPDDIEIGCGATLRRLRDESPEVAVHWVVFSGSGERCEEAEVSARGWLPDENLVHLEICNYRDSYFPADYETLKEKMSELASSCNPDLIFTHRLEDRHQDHRLIAELTWCAFRNHLILEYEIPKFEGDLGTPNMFVAINQQEAEGKIARLLSCFASQREKPWFDERLFQALMRLRGAECHAASGFAEAFTCRKGMLL